MDRAEFASRFLTFVADAVSRGSTGVPVAPGGYAIEIHGAGHRGVRMTVDEAADALYLGPESFYRIIDVGILDADENEVRLFVRPSDHPPGRWSETWAPSGDGPFKFLGVRQ